MPVMMHKSGLRRAGCLRNIHSEAKNSTTVTPRVASATGRPVCSRASVSIWVKVSKIMAG